MVGALYYIFPLVGIYLCAKVRGKIRDQKGIEVSSLDRKWIYFEISNSDLTISSYLFKLINESFVVL